MENKPQVPSGFMSPEGVIYEAATFLHEEEAMYIVLNVLGEPELEGYAIYQYRLMTLGWVRLDINNVYVPDELTPAQAAKLRDFCADAYAHDYVSRAALLECLQPRRKPISDLIVPGRKRPPAD